MRHQKMPTGVISAILSNTDAELCQQNGQANTAGAQLKLLWIVNLNYEQGMLNGSFLRFYHYSKNLLAKGHEVYFLTKMKKSDDPDKKKNFLNKLKTEGVITDYVELDYQTPKLPTKIANIIGHPAVVNFLLRKHQKKVQESVKKTISKHNINLCIISERELLFVAPAIKADVTTIIDWVDSYTLYRIREITASLKRGALTRLPTAFRYLIYAFAEESYYGRRGSINLVVSPIDKRYIDRINGVPGKNRVLLNGVKGSSPRAGARKIKNRLVFTGNMDFPPNYEAAKWFIETVMPLLLKSKPDVKLVLAGANPTKELSAKASENIEITGYVSDMTAEIAKSELYIAPLVSGGGFKNKIVEALVSGTFVIATEMAVEFLDPGIQQKIMTARSSEEMAEKTLYFLNHPREFDERLEELRKIIQTDFPWERRADELVDLAHSVAKEM